MLDLAITLALQDAGLCKYGRDAFCASSPILDNGNITATSGLWVNINPTSSNKAKKTAQVTIDTRDDDVIHQGLLIAWVSRWVDEVLPTLCCLSCAPILDMEYKVVNSSTCNTPTIVTVDGEGRFVKQLQFTLDYQNPENLPSLADYKSV